MSFSHRICIIRRMNYLYYEFKISKICSVKENQNTYHSYLSMSSFFNERCLENGSSLKGRQDAFIYQMHVKKFIPVIVSIKNQEIYFPNTSKKDPNCIWINYANIQNVQYFKTHCIIQFKDHTHLECEHPKRIQHSLQLIFRYINKNAPA